MITKDQMFTSLYRMFHSWEELAHGTSDFTAGLKHSIPVVPYQEGQQLQRDFSETMDALKDVFKSVSSTEDLSDYNISHIYEDTKGDDGIRYEQTTLNLRKAICAEVYQVLLDNTFIWTKDNSYGIWVSTNGIFVYSDPKSITAACTKECLDLVLKENGKGFNICVDTRTDEDGDTSLFFTADLTNN